MKFILTIAIFIISNFSSFSGEVTGAGISVNDLLIKSGHSEQYLMNNDLKVTLGEVTGAGKVHIDDVHAFIIKNTLKKDHQIISINFLKNSPGKILKDIESIKFNDLDLEIVKKDIRAIIHRR